MRKYLDLSSWIILFALLPVSLLAFLSQNAVPGELFYPVKRGLENVVLVASSVHPATKVAFRTDLTERRFAEAESLLLLQGQTTALTEFVTDFEIIEEELAQISSSEEKKELSENLIAKINEYETKLVAVQTQIAQENQIAFVPSTPTPAPSSPTQQPATSTPIPVVQPSPGQTVTVTPTPTPTPIAIVPSPVVNPTAEPTFEPVPSGDPELPQTPEDQLREIEESKKKLREAKERIERERQEAEARQKFEEEQKKREDATKQNIQIPFFQKDDDSEREERFREIEQELKEDSSREVNQNNVNVSSFVEDEDNDDD